MQKNYSLLVSFKTLLTKETRRFLKVWGQTILGPIITISLFLGVFSVAIGSNIIISSEISYIQFLIPGLIMMSIIQNSFANSSSSLIISKLQGNLDDILMAPLKTNTFILAHVIACLLRGLLIGSFTLLYVSFLTDVLLINPFFIVLFVFLSAAFLGLLGIIAGIVSTKFDHLSHFTNLVIIPFSFLSGTFYQISRLPDFLQTIIGYNPFFYMIDGFRYGFIGIADSNIVFGIAYLSFLNILLYMLVYWMWSRGYKIKQ